MYGVEAVAGPLRLCLTAGRAALRWDLGRAAVDGRGRAAIDARQRAAAARRVPAAAPGARQHEEIARRGFDEAARRPARGAVGARGPGAADAARTTRVLAVLRRPSASEGRLRDVMNAQGKGCDRLCPAECSPGRSRRRRPERPQIGEHDDQRTRYCAPGTAATVEPNEAPRPPLVAPPLPRPPSPPRTETWKEVTLESGTVKAPEV